MFDGVREAAKREAALSEWVVNLRNKPSMVSVFFGDDLASVLYTRLKQEVAARVGIGFFAIEQSFADKVDEIEGKIRKFNADEKIQGIMIQKPAQSTWLVAGGLWQKGSPTTRHTPHTTSFAEWWRSLADTIDPKKDVDGLTGKGRVMPATVKAVIAILSRIKNEELIIENYQETAKKFVRGKRVVVIGRSDIVGKPLSLELEKMGAKVSNVGSGEPDLGNVTRQADILVSATGRENLVTAEMVKEGAIVIDVGSPQGDVDFASVAQKASFITPVPDGVGPMTVVSLLENLLDLSL